MPQENEVIDEVVVAPVAKDDWVPPTRAQMESLQRERDESRESEKYWSGIARKPAEPVEKADDASEFIDPNAADGIEGDTPEKLVDEFAAQGVAALKARGFITAKAAQKLVAETALKVVNQALAKSEGARRDRDTNTEIMSEYPELRDQTSDLFKATAKIYQESIARNPKGQGDPEYLRMAARAAKAGLKPSSGETEHETDRRQRADSQDGRTRGRGESEDRGDMITAEERDMIKACGITEAEFRESQKMIGKGRR